MVQGAKQATAKGAASLPKAVDDCRELIKWVVGQLDKFPRQRRFTLGDRIETRLPDVMENLLTAAFSRDKAAALERANSALNVSNQLWRISFELQSISIKSYEHGARLMLGLGGHIGGWRRSEKAA